LNGWALSGITTFQTGFPVRITTLDDQELMYSFDFELPGEPDLVAPFHTLKPQKNGNYFFDPSSFSEDNTFGRIGNSPRTICCGPRISNTDFAVLKTIGLSETRRIDFAPSSSTSSTIRSFSILMAIFPMARNSDKSPRPAIHD